MEEHKHGSAELAISRALWSCQTWLLHKIRDP